MSNFVKHFSEKWLIYLISLILIFTFWLAVIDEIVAVKPSEKIGIFLGTYGIYQSVDEEIEKPSGIEKIEIFDANINEDYYFVIFAAYASNNDFDFSIVNEKQFRESDIQYYQTLDQEVIAAYFGEREYFSLNDNIYGIKIYDGETKEGILSDYVSYCIDDVAEDYYLFFHKNSSHIGLLNNSSDDKAIQLIQALINQYTEEVTENGNN